MTDTDDTDANHAEQLFNRTLEFNDGASIHATAWDVPANETYPDGVHYRFHFGSPNGTIIRYDNAHNGRHEWHNSDGTIEAIDFPGVVALYEIFLHKVAEWRDETKPE